MPDVQCHRYFLAFLPGPGMRGTLAAMREETGQRQRPVRTEHFHLTLCILAEAPERERFTETRISGALSGFRPPSCPIRLGRLVAGSGGAALQAIGRQDELGTFRHDLLHLLARRGLAPCRQAQRFQAHVTLGRDPVPSSRRLAPLEWVPGELVLIESEVGRTIHHVRGRWPLLPPPQGVLPFHVPVSLGLVAGDRR